MAKNTGSVVSTLSSVTTKYDVNHAYDIKVSEVWVDWKWNARFTTDEGDAINEGGAFKDTLVSIGKEGQRTPCVVRPNPFHGKKGNEAARYPFMLVEGFQRTRAVCDIAAGEADAMLGAAGLDQVSVNKLHTKEPTIRAFVVPMSEGEARRRNLGENMLRAQLSAPDIAFGVAKLAEAEPEASNKALGEMIGRSEPYVAKLRRIYSTFSNVKVPAGALHEGSAPVSVLESWRSSPKKALNEDLLAIADADAKEPLSAEEKADRYLMAIGAKVDPNAKPKKKAGQGAWSENACIDAKAFGVLLGNLARDGAIEVDGITADHWALVASKYAGKADKATEDEREAIAFACNEGIKLGKKKAPKVAPKAEEEPAPKKSAAAKKSAANGKASHA